MKTLRGFLFLALTVCLPGYLHCQNELTLYQMGSVPERISLNPSFIPPQGGYIGLPVISGFGAGTSIPFIYNDVIKRDQYDSLELQVEGFINSLSKNDVIRFNSSANLFSYGTLISNGKFYLEISIKSKVSQDIHIPAQLMQLMWYGNHAPGLFGEHLGVSPRVNALAYDEIGVSFAGQAMEKKLSWGIKAKYLSGRFNIKSVRSNFDFYTDPETFALWLQSDLDIQTSGIDQIDKYFDQPLNALAFPGNNGFGLDLGASYQINQRFSVNASILDLGYIHWNTRTLKMVSHDPGAQYKFNGLTLGDFMELFGEPDRFAKRVEDTLRKLVKIDSVYGESYNSGLPLRFFAGGSFQLNENHRFNALFNGTVWDKNFYPAFSASYNYAVRRNLELSLSYNIFNHQYLNIGAGLSFHTGPFQFYAVSDNVTGLIFYKSHNNYSFQFGINILLNRNQGLAQNPPDVEKSSGE